MTSIKYYFDQLPFSKNGNYILQIVQNRALSNIYHFHDFYEIILILRGQASHTVNSHNYEMNTGDCVILCPGDSHTFTSQSNDLEVLGFSITENEFQKFSSSFEAIFTKNSNCFSETTVFSCLNRLAEIRNLSCNNYYQTNIVSNQKLLLCTILNCYCTNSSNTTSNIPLILQHAVNEMHTLENLREGVNRMVHLTNYSRSHLCRLMKKYYQQSPHDFINDLRLKTAYNMVLYSDLSIDDISENVGYNSISHFNIIFKKEFGISPAILRKNSSIFQSI